LVFNRLLDPEPMFYSDMALFILGGYIDSQNNRYWNIKAPYSV
jgi:hypothetical protein